jgi:cell division septation protein DedD
LKKKENEQMPTASELDYPEVLPGNKPPEDREVDPRLIDRKTKASDAGSKPETPGQDPSKMAALQPRQAAKPENANIKKSNYTIQVAAYKNATYSRRLVNQLKKKGFPAFQVQSPSGGGKAVMYRVRVGAFENRSAAETTLAKLRSRQYDGLVVSTK